MAPQMISPGFVEDALECLHRQRIPAEPVLRAAGLPVAVREPVTPQQYGRLWLAIASAIDDEFFGLAARPMRRGSFTLLCHAVLDAGTLEKALRRALQFLRVVLDEPRGGSSSPTVRRRSPSRKQARPILRSLTGRSG
jgi:hypothetical protein